MKLTQRPDDVAQEAIEWMVLLRSGDATEDDFRQYERWRYSDDRHDAACAKIEATLGKIQTLNHSIPKENLRQTLLAPSSRRQFLQKACGVAALGVFSGLILNQRYPLPYLLSDAYTDTGQRRRIQLNDGSTLDMNARTALNISLDETLRKVELRTGGIIAEVVDDQRPFTIATHAGRILAQEARFHVRQESSGIHLAVLNAVVKVTNRNGDSRQVQAGQGLWFDHQSFIPLGVSPYEETAWTQGRLEVKDATLGSVINSLKNYSPAVIRVAPAVADLRVSGNFPLDNIPYTLDALAQTMPIAITRTTNYWIRIEPAAS